MLSNNPFSRQRPIVRAEAKETYCNAQRITGFQPFSLRTIKRIESMEHKQQRVQIKNCVNVAL